jgi:y4mF family transcriptional regulator
MFINQLANTLKLRRSTLGITQLHLAELADVNVNTIIRIENGKINPTLEVINKISEVLGLELSLDIKKTNP